MILQTEGGLTFAFPDNWHVSKYDDWPFYRNQLQQSCLGSKAVDFLAMSPSLAILWLIEVKDYRAHPRTKGIAILDEMALKVKDTLAGLVAAKMAPSHDNHGFASTCLKAKRLRVVLHLEQPTKPSKLFPRPYDRADLEQKLRQLLKPIDAHPLVTEMARLHGLEWSVSSS